MKSVLHISGKSSFDGTSIFPLILASNLEEYNHAIIYLNKGKAQKEMIEKGINIFNLFPIDKNRTIFFKILKFLFLYNKINTYNIIHYHSGGISILLLAVILFQNKKIIQHIHCGNINCKSFNHLSKIEKMIYKYIGKRVIVIASSQRAYHNYKLFSHSCKNLYLVENSVPITYKKKANPTNILGYIGQVSKEKGSDLLINLIKKCPNNHFLIKGEIKDKIILSKLQSFRNVEIQNPSLDTNSFYQSIDILLFPSEALESSPLVIWEAFFNDVSIIINKNSVQNSFLKSYPFLVDFSNTEYVKQFLSEFYSNSDLRNKLSEFHFSTFKENNFMIFKDNIKKVYNLKSKT